MGQFDASNRVTVGSLWQKPIAGEARLTEQSDILDVAGEVDVTGRVGLLGEQQDEGQNRCEFLVIVDRGQSTTNLRAARAVCSIAKQLRVDPGLVVALDRGLIRDAD
jgi:hypothetical protein